MLHHKMDLSREILQPAFDLEQYLGTWYEIAKTPNFFEIGCASAKAEYAQKTRTTVAVKNTCLGEDGRKKSRTCEEAGGRGCRGFNNTVPPVINGEAVVVDPQYPAALRVRFPSEPEFLPPNIPNYLVHSTDYCSYAIVGDTQRKFLFILSRKPTMSKQLFNEVDNFSRNIGYDTSQLIINTRKYKPVVR